METEVSGLDLQTWLEENAPPPPVGENELTPAKAVEAWGVSYNKAKRILREKAEAGELKEVIRIHPNGKTHPAYVIVE